VNYIIILALTFYDAKAIIIIIFIIIIKQENNEWRIVKD